MPITCRAAIASGNGSFEIDTVQVHHPIGTEILVKVKAASLCHTDHDSLNWGYPVVLGHEGSGIVEAVGPNVSSVVPGDEVILNWATYCGTCYQCNLGNRHICENNSPVVAGKDSQGQARMSGTLWNDRHISRSFNIGTLSEFTLVQESAVVKNPKKGIPCDSVCLISCGVMTGYGSVVNAAKIQPGCSVVVLGTGGVGLNVIQGARISGASRIIAVDINQQRLHMAMEFGATDSILAESSDTYLLSAAEKVKVLTQGRGADYSFECTAIPKLGAAPLAMIRNAGMAVQVSGIEEKVTIDMELFEWDKVYINPLYGKCNPDRDFPQLVDLYYQGKLLLDEMVTNTYSLDQLQYGFDDMLSGKNAKGVILL